MSKLSMLSVWFIIFIILKSGGACWYFCFPFPVAVVLRDSKGLANNLASLKFHDYATGPHPLTILAFNKSC